MQTCTHYGVCNEGTEPKPHSEPLLESYHVTTDEDAAEKAFHVCSVQQESIPSSA